MLIVYLTFSSFKTSKEMGQLAKDKNGFFAFGERISEEELRMDIGNEQVEKLKNCSVLLL